LYDSRDRSSIITKKVIKLIPFLNKYTDKEKDILGKYSSMLFTLNNFVNANKKIIKLNDNDDEMIEFLKEYWGTVVFNISEWDSLEKKTITKTDLRENYIVTQGVTILALGELGEFIYKNNKDDFKQILVGLRNIDWSRSNEKDWYGSAIKQNGRINRTSLGITLTCIRIKKLLGINLTSSEKIQLERNRGYYGS
jgi:DNA sulfur modification protein DndB